MKVDQIYTKVLAEHNNSKRNKHHLENPTMVLKGANPNCGDEIELELRIEDGVIEDVSFTGIGCAVSQASASILVDLIKGKTIEEALKLKSVFSKMIATQWADEEAIRILGEAASFQNISHMPARVKCAMLAWNTLEKAVV